MTLYFSASAGAFFDSTIHSAWPKDAREITAEAHAALMDAQAEGKMIVANDNGDAVAVDRPTLGADELAAAMRRKRNRLLAECDWTQAQDAPFTAVQRDAWQAYRQALRDLPETTDDVAAIAWPSAPA